MTTSKAVDIKYTFEESKRSMSQLIRGKYTVAEARRRGFGRWDDTKRPLLLIPLWMFDAIPKGAKFETINGDTIVFNRRNADRDQRFGYLAYGVRCRRR